MKGWQGTILRVDLSQGKVTEEPLNKDLAHKYVGGRGLNSRVLWEELPPGVDPLGPENKIIIGVGPCNGTIVPGSQRFTVTFKSPLNGMFGDSNSGGSFGAELKYAGYDMVIIQGQAPKPVYLWIDDDQVELKPAGHLWGKTIRETRRAIESEIGDPDISTITIGPAGENLVRFACAIADLGRALGRTGAGAVFGSKRLKALAVRGTKGVRVANTETLEEAVRKTYEGWGKHTEQFLEGRRRLGPSASWARYDHYGMLGAKNFQQGTFEGWKSMMAHFEEYTLKLKACFSCPAGCDHMYIVSKGPYAGTYGDGLELVQPMVFGPAVGAKDLDIVLKASTVCDGLGVDMMDMAGIIGFAMECFQRGILTAEDTGGLKLEWGSAEAILKLIEMTALREGIGDIFAEGVKKASETIGRGSEECAMQAKNQTLVQRDPRASKGWALAYAVSTRGPCHVRANMLESYPAWVWDIATQEIHKKYKDSTNLLVEEGKPELLKWHEDLSAFKNSMEICLFSLYQAMFSVSTLQILAQFYNSVTGLSIDERELLRIGERIVNIERAFNIREGLTRADDTLPDRMLKEPLPDGPAKGQVVNLKPMLDEYYGFRGWDKGSGFPSREKLLELELDDVADELERMGKLAPPGG